MSSKVMVIAGMHRSGTSLVTQWLYRCGLPIGDNLFPADVGNVDGHFEDTDFLEIHRQFLVSRKFPDTGFIDGPIGELNYHEINYLKDLVDKKNQQNNEWGWKEPRTCLFLDIYEELIPDAFYLFIVRDFRSTLNSMLSREYKVHIKKFNTKRGLSRLKWILFKKKSIEQMYAIHAEHFLKVWINYNEHVLNHAWHLPPERYVFVRFASLANEDEEVFNHLKNEWGFSLHYVPFTDVYKKELLSEVREVEKYITDKTLIEKAKRIEEEFSKFLIPV